MQQRVGTCSLCGGDVMGERGVRMRVLPPPPDRCSQCGAVRCDDVIPMHKPGVWPVVIRTYTAATTAAAQYCRACGGIHSPTAVCFGRLAGPSSEPWPAGPQWTA